MTPTHEVERYIDHAFTADGWEGDELRGGPIALAGTTLELVRYACSSDFDQPRDNWLGIHGAHDYYPPGPSRHLTVVAQNEGRPVWGLRWNGKHGSEGSYGNVVMLEHPDGETSLYAHLESFSAVIEAWLAAGGGATNAPWLEVGDPIGIMGNTGNVWPAPDVAGDLESGKHLHFERRAHPAYGSTLLDPVARIVVASELHRPVSVPPTSAPPDPNPEPNQPYEPTQLGPAQALAEAQMFYRLAFDLSINVIDYADPYGAAIDALKREAGELVAAYGTVAPVAEAEALVGLLEVYEQYPVGYDALLEAVLREAGELLQALQAAIPAA